MCQSKTVHFSKRSIPALFQKAASRSSIRSIHFFMSVARLSPPRNDAVNEGSQCSSKLQQATAGSSWHDGRALNSGVTAVLGARPSIPPEPSACAYARKAHQNIEIINTPIHAPSDLPASTCNFRRVDPPCASCSHPSIVIGRAHVFPAVRTGRG